MITPQHFEAWSKRFDSELRDDIRLNPNTPRDCIFCSGKGYERRMNYIVCKGKGILPFQEGS